ncbi:MAG: ADP-glyceromanno-heptose 6-epimerase [Verrucomicrobia bacterium]|nr:ADP-glyceromanno-heptose 6-epimerase [Verrucomicrobiota bacterium]MBU6447001.1 ADP-glyceromanno-heptose 6-epimerase [Verrucomicrobiota bacterium]MDE3047780.1 ADP-glyceromanno-heptose 6-epimerase [Verrucomicrobiota bacterium]
MKIVITGASGMIGSCLVRHLNEMGLVDLVLIDDLKTGDKWKNLVGKQFDDILSKHVLFDWLKSHGSSVDAIVHLGACSDTTEKNADYLIENNFHYTVRLAEWALTHSKRFIYASSAATYGDGSLGFCDDESALETLRPLNMYGYSKHLVDLWMKRRNVLSKVVGLKYFNVFGPNEYHKGRMASMVLKMMDKSHDGSAVHLFKSSDAKYPDGGQMRDFIYVKDAVKMTACFLDPQYRNVGGIFNIGLGVPTTWNQLADAFFQAIEKKTNIAYIDMPADLVKQYQQFTCASMDKFHKIFSQDSKVTQTTSIVDAVRDYVSYLKRNDRW